MSDRTRTVQVTVNGRMYERTVEPRLLLVDFLRHDCGLTGSHVGCAHGVCGACTVLLNGVSARSCPDLLRAGGRRHRLPPSKGLADGEIMDTLQQAFQDHHALQCGYCTPGFLMSLAEFLGETPDPDEAAIRRRLAGNLLPVYGLRQHRQGRSGSRRGRLRREAGR